jgi:hypothetical protein
MIEKEEITGAINARKSSTAPISLSKSPYNVESTAVSISGKSGSKMYAQYLRDERSRARKHSMSRSDTLSKVDSARANSLGDRRSRPSHTPVASADSDIDFGVKFH